MSYLELLGYSRLNSDVFSGERWVLPYEDIACAWEDYIIRMINEKKNEKWLGKSTTFRVMTFNVNRFLGFRVNEAKNKFTHLQFNTIVTQLKPDILCLQETPCARRCGPAWILPVQVEMARLGYVCFESQAGWVVNNTIFVREDLDAEYVGSFTTGTVGNECTIMGVRVKNTFFWNLHLDVQCPSKSLQDFERQLLESNLEKIIGNSFFLGDFNSSAESHTIKEFSKKFEVALVGRQPLSTSIYGGAIDHILVPKRCLQEVKEIGPFFSRISDHLPIILDAVIA